MSNIRELSQLASVINVNDETKNVGIGTTNPESKLSVGGDLTASGNITAVNFYGDGSQLTGISASSASSSSQWVTTASGIHTLSNVGIGTTNSTSKLNVGGDARITGVITCTDINSTSDVNLKKNIQTFDNALNVVQNIRGVRFDWKENDKSSVGVIAQEIEKVLPELVNSGEIKTVNYNGLIGVLIEAIKEQQRQIDELKKH